MDCRIARILLVVGGLAVTGLQAAPPAGTLGHYRVLPGGFRSSLPFNAVDISYGPQPWAGGEACRWKLSVYQEDEPDTEPLFELRATTSRDPLANAGEPMDFLHYQLHIPSTGERYSYRDANQPGRALLPNWGHFVRDFLPHPAQGSAYQQGMPNTCEYLGHVLTLREVRAGVDWPEWKNVKPLNLDRELWVGSGRTAKDAEGHRLPQTPERQNYNYVQWTLDDYRAMIEAGFNHFAVVPGALEYVRSQPVFYRGGTELVHYPVDLYRTNYVGPMMYMDEPTCIMVNNKVVQTTLKYFTDAAALITNRVRTQYEQHMYALHNALQGAGVGLGGLRVVQTDFVSWETRYETAFYQLAGGGAGFVHEGRYQLGEFNEFARASTGLDRTHTAEEMFKYYFAFMRGAARHFDKDWGISIYGQADPALSPLAITMAYDMGARYVWYWTSDHDHHMPWPEQLDLTRKLRRHAATKRRPSIRSPRPLLDKVIVIPFGYFLVLESPTNRKNCWDLWWVRVMDAEGKNDASQRYRRLMRNAFVEVHKALDANESFDFTVDDGRDITGYRQVIRITDQ